MRTETVTIGGKEIVVREKLIKELKQDVLPKLESAWEAIIQGNVANVAEILTDQLQEIFPELNGVNLDECYPSEIEGFLEACISVNFTGLKRIALPLWSLIQQGSRLSG